MKRSYLFAFCILAFSTAVSAQDRPRFFDNFDTARGVHVIKPASAKPTVQASNTASPISYSTPSGNTKVINGKRFLMPAGMSEGTTAAKANRSSRVTKTGSTELLAARNSQPHMTMGTVAGLRGFTTGSVMHDTYIVESSRKYGIDPLLIYAQMHQESAFKIRATSHKGASGLMQLMPATARRLGVTNIYDPKQNIEGGVKYMRMLLDMFGQNVHLALAGYNAGEGAVMKYGYSIPPYNETREYVRRISARYSTISNPSLASSTPKVSSKTAAKLAAKETPPLSLTQNAMTIRLPDGRMRLVN